MTTLSPLFHELIAGRPAALELDEAALEIARIHDPGLDAGATLALLDEWAEEIKAALPPAAGGAQYLHAAHTFLFGKLGLRGDREDYYAPENSCLHLVMERRRGLPITLAALYMEIARRLLRPVYGVPLPGHFVCRYNDGLIDVLVDVFHGGELLTPGDAWALAEAATGRRATPPPDALAPAPHGQILARMLNNLRNAYLRRGDGRRARLIGQYFEMMSPTVQGGFRR